MAPILVNLCFDILVFQLFVFKVIESVTEIVKHIGLPTMETCVQVNQLIVAGNEDKVEGRITSFELVGEGSRP